jgi:hypothetical protein
MKSPELSCIIIMWQNNGDVVHIMQVWLAQISHSHLFEQNRMLMIYLYLDWSGFYV